MTQNTAKAAHNGGPATRYRGARHPNLYLEVGTRLKTWRYRKFWKTGNFTETLAAWPNKRVIEAAQTAAAINQRVEEMGITRHDHRRRNAPEITLRVALKPHCTQLAYLRERLGLIVYIPPAEAQQAFYANLNTLDMVASYLNQSPCGILGVVQFTRLPRLRARLIPRGISRDQTAHGHNGKGMRLIGNRLATSWQAASRDKP